MSPDVKSYRVYVEPLAQRLGGGFVSYAPQLKGCISDGSTPEEALHNIYDAIDCWIESAVAHGESIPEPGRVPQFA